MDKMYINVMGYSKLTSKWNVGKVTLNDLY